MSKALDWIKRHMLLAVTALILLSWWHPTW